MYLFYRCIEAWNLISGEILEAEIQFQLDRTRFCSCHYALDQLKANKQLALVCPSFDHVNSARAQSFNLDQNSLNLDPDQVLLWHYIFSSGVSKLFIVDFC